MSIEVTVGTDATGAVTAHYVEKSNSNPHRIATANGNLRTKRQTGGDTVGVEFILVGPAGAKFTAFQFEQLPWLSGNIVDRFGGSTFPFRDRSINSRGDYLSFEIVCDNKGKWKLSFSIINVTGTPVELCVDPEITNTDEVYVQKKG